MNSSSVSPLVKVHPAVLLAIAEHYQRRPAVAEAQAQRVIGTLLGTASGGLVKAVAVPHSEVDTQVAVNTELHRQSLELHRKSTGGDQLLGWYYVYEGKEGESQQPSQAFMAANTAFFHELFAKEAGASASNALVMLEVCLGQQEQPQCRAWTLSEGAWASLPVALTAPLAEAHLLTSLRRQLLQSPQLEHHGVERGVGEVGLTVVPQEALSLAHLQAGLAQLSSPPKTPAVQQAMADLALAQTDDALDRLQVGKDMAVLQQSLTRLKAQLPALRRLQAEVEQHQQQQEHS